MDLVEVHTRQIAESTDDISTWFEISDNFNCLNKESFDYEIEINHMNYPLLLLLLLLHVNALQSLRPWV